MLAELSWLRRKWRERGREGREGKSSDFSREVLTFMKISSDFSREVLKFIKISGDFSRDVLKFMKISSQKHSVYDTS